MKDNNKKEIKYLNVCMDKALHEEFEAFCKAHGMSKVGAPKQTQICLWTMQKNMRQKF